MEPKSPTHFTANLPLKIRIRNYAASCLGAVILRRDGTVNRCLFNCLEFAASFLPTPRDDVVSTDYVVDPVRNLWLRLYFPTVGELSARLPVIVYFHGGGFALFTPKSKPYDEFCRRLVEELPAVVVSVNYRLSPENRCPCQYEDGFDVLDHFDQSELGELLGKGDLSRCFLAGDSAGANLAHHVLVRASGHKFERIRIRGLIAIQPFFGGEERTESEIRLRKAPSLSLKNTDFFWKAFLPVGSDRNHPAAHVFGPKSVDLTSIQYPPTIVFIGGTDLLQDWQSQYVDWLTGSGKEVRVAKYPNMFHGFYVVAKLAESSMLVDEIKNFIYMARAV